MGTDHRKTYYRVEQDSWIPFLNTTMELRRENVIELLLGKAKGIVYMHPPLYPIRGIDMRELTDVERETTFKTIKPIRRAELLQFYQWLRVNMPDVIIRGADEVAILSKKNDSSFCYIGSDNIKIMRVGFYHEIREALRNLTAGYLSV